MPRLLAWLLLSIFGSVFACTMFTTFDGKDNSILAAKNRDNRPDNQIIQVVAEKGKLKYLALSRSDVPEFVSAGINEKNLAVFNEVTIEYASQAKGGIADDFSKDILQNYQHARDVIPDLPKLIAKYPDPVFYQVVDNHELLAIEVAPGQKYKYKLIEQGTFTHANNYLESELVSQYPYSEVEEARLLGSETRANRANYLLNKNPLPTVETMQMIALDHSAGYNNSIYRSGEESNPASVRSLAFFMVKIAKDGSEPASISSYLYSQGSKYNYILDKKFWAKYQSGYNLLTPNIK